MTISGDELAKVLSDAALKANANNLEPKAPLVRLRLHPEGIMLHVSFKTLHFTRLVKYVTILSSRYSSGALELEITNAVAEINKAA